MKILKDIGSLLKQTYDEWDDDHANLMAAALAYYTFFSIAPLLVIAIAIAGLAFGDVAAHTEIFSQIEALVGAKGAQAIESVIRQVQNPTGSFIATSVAFILLILGASIAFNHLQTALNSIWNIKKVERKGWLQFLRHRLISFSIVIGTGFFLLVSLLVNAALAAVSHYYESLFFGREILYRSLNWGISFAIVAILFAMIFKWIPDVRVRWTDVWIGAVTTAVLFNIGKYLIGLYLGQSSVSSIYGAAGSLVIVLIWIYYSCQILFFGAELTYVYARRYGSLRDLQS